ncbi:MAG: succinyldiaminopimelate transaminase [Actinobacteria bacterium]|nr:succinyldiaminopimelate transaminase [Actinomycetota bacterium]NBQ59829.1 succinyldiaminopimelate transaminase [Actinomycetota bacterium]NBY83051.1 succinyldiaminopimelate transaminase [Actinomycetota bacterium]NCU96799.1 succinyldiaminopimelate transaminase [Actinomycetota bacterium]NCZ76440.1 succinyldiaminopimelate transaminase [Actinomycetota bacterium]
MKLPDFPWDLLAPYGEKAKKYQGGFIDLSQGTPVDPTPKFIQDALASASNSPSYPLTAGSEKLRSAIRDWATSNLGATGEFDVLPVIGSKEFVALLPTFLQSKTVLYPKVAYPTYLVGALMASAKAIPVEIDAKSWPVADLAWINSPSNPTGQVQTDSEILAAINWARENNSVVASDECYLSFSKLSKSILALTGGNNDGVLSVHSLSKRSNLAGYRAAFVIGDLKLIDQIRQIRKHAGLMVSLPVQQAMIAALSDNNHAIEQAERYARRRSRLISAFSEIGFTIEHSQAGLYIWCSKNEDCFKTVEWFANLGILVTPGSFYGSDKFIRVALTTSDENIDEVVKRINP